MSKPIIVVVVVIVDVVFVKKKLVQRIQAKIFWTIKILDPIKFGFNKILDPKEFLDQKMHGKKRFR